MINLNKCLKLNDFINNNMKTLFLTLVLLTLASKSQEPEDDENIKKLSNFLIQLISKYDVNGAGFIKR